MSASLAAFCAKGLDFKLVNLYDMDRASGEKRKAHLVRVETLADRI